MTEINRQENGNIELKLVIPWTDIQKEYEKVVNEAVENAEVEGFRKGKAPRDMVLPRLDQNKLYSRSIERLLPPVYSSAITEHNVKPIIQPHIHLVSGEEGKDWTFTAVTCELPVATLPENFTEELKKLAKDGEDKLTPQITWLREHSTVKVPDTLIEEESNHRLSGLADNVTRLGLSMDSYLQSRKLTPETLRAQTADQARTDLETEFVLEAVRNAQKLQNRKETLDFLQSLI